MIEGQEVTEELIHLLSVEGQPAKAVLAQTCVDALFIQESDTIFAVLYLPKPPADHRRPPDELLRTTVLQTLLLSITSSASARATL
jgi:hypothetical protein